MKKKIFIFFCIIILFSSNIIASHLMGGTLGYEYLGLQPNGKYRYKVNLTTYIDCGPTSEIPYAEYPLKVGVYANNLLNPAADKILLDSLYLFVDDTTVYTPYLPPGCNIGANTCIIQARYSGYIEVQPSVSGYFLYYERCCRNAAILNLQPDGSDGFLAYIPPTNVVNSSPVFIYPPIPFLCVNDTGVIFNTATDADGDSLVYEFSIPFNGFGSTSNPQPPIPSPTLTWPVFPVDYVAGFSFTNPFSFFGSASINSSNGVSNYFCLLQGTFVVGVVVKEYRSGVLISQTFRDLQLLFNNCPNNFSPELVDNLQRNYTVTQGDTLCFPISFQDPENDSTFIEAYGDIFDSLLVDTPAIFTITDIDSNKATGNFCWTIPCAMDTGIYHFFMRSYDDGCPPKERFEFYTIRITPPIEPNLLGADTACKGTDSVLYWMVVDDNFNYNWNVINGTVVQNYGDSIVVDWGSIDSGKVVVDVYTAAGCYLSSDSLDITLIDVPSLFAMPDDTVCRNDTLLLWAVGSVNYYWYPESSMIHPHEGNGDAIITESGWFYVAGLPGELCPPSDSVYISVLDLPVLDAFYIDSNLCEGDTISLFSSGAVTYHWTPSALIFNPDSANTDAISMYSGNFIVMGMDSNQCRNFDTVYVDVKPAPVITLAAVTGICLGDTATITASGGINYTWWPNTFLLPDTGAIVNAYPDTNTTYNLEITDSNGCKTDTSFSIIVSPFPTASFDYDTLKVDCSGSWIQFTNTSTGITVSHWTLGNGNQSTDLNPQTLYPFGGSYIVTLVVINAFQCSSSFVDTISTDPLQNLVVFKQVNVFTPNDDGTNDSLDFNLPIEFLDCSKVYVYDRWGLLMFESSIGTLSWDGKVDGKKVPEGVYYWIVEVNNLPFKGFVHLFK